MFKNYLLTTLRRLGRHKSHAAINVGGLAIGMGCCLVIFLLITYEHGFDRFHTRVDRIYRVVTDEHMNDLVDPTMGTPIPMAEALRHDFPGLEKVTVTYGLPGGQFTVTRADRSVARFQETNNVAFVEPEFFEVFDFPWIVGDPGSLAEPNAVALTERIATKFFGSEPAVGKTIVLDNHINLKVTGIVRDFPVQTDFPFAVIISWKTLPQTGMDVLSWGHISSDVNTYVVLRENVSPDALQSALPAFKNRYHPDEKDPTKRVHRLQPLSEVHNDDRYGNYTQHIISKGSLVGLGLIGIFLLITACINFVNMATALAGTRAKEIGVRKVMGAARSQIIAQYLGETFIITIMGAVCAMGLAELSLPRVNEILKLRLDVHPLGDIRLLGFMVALVMIVSVLAGLYPAFVLSRFMPATVLKGQGRTPKGGGLLLRRGLVTLQFVISQMLIIGTIVVSMQVDYFRNKEMGFDKSAIITVPLPENQESRLKALRARLEGNSSIEHLTFALASAASDNSWDTNLRHTLHGPEETFTSDLKFADAEYALTYGLQFVAGRNYTASDTVNELVVNETFASKLGVSPLDLIGKTFRLGRRTGLPIVGVVRDFHARPLQERIRPCLLAANRNAYQEASIKIRTPRLKEALASIEEAWSSAFPEFVYSYQFLDDRLAGFYEDEQKMSTVLRVFSGVAILVGCLGLFGLMSFVASQRVKEIGVRKVLGASAVDILTLLAREFVVLVAIAFAIAAPVAFVVMNNWLANYAYRVTIGVGVLLAGLLATVVIAALTVGYRAVKAATMNPVDAVRYE